MDYQKEISNLRNVALASIDKAQHVSLLSELVQGGLHGKLDMMAKEKTPVCELEVHSPQVTFNDEKWNKLRRKNLLGSIDPQENKIEQVATNSRSLMESAPQPKVKSKVRRVVTISEVLPESAEDKVQRYTIGGPSSQSSTTSIANLIRKTTSRSLMESAPRTKVKSKVRRVVTISEDLPESAEDKVWRYTIGGPSSQPSTTSIANLIRKTASTAPATMPQSLVSHRESNMSTMVRAVSPERNYWDLDL